VLLITSHRECEQGVKGTLLGFWRNVSTLRVYIESLEFVYCIAATNINTWWQYNSMTTPCICSKTYCRQNTQRHTNTHTQLVETCHVHSHILGWPYFDFQKRTLGPETDTRSLLKDALLISMHLK